MKITRAHYHWWMAKQKPPKLFADHKPAEKVSIHDLINCQMPEVKDPKRCVRANTYTVLNRWRHRDTPANLTFRLWELYRWPGCMEGEVRSAMCGRLLRRYYRSQGKSRKEINSYFPNNYKRG